MNELVKKAADSIAYAKGAVAVRVAVVDKVFESGLTGQGYETFVGDLRRELIKRGQDNSETLASVQLALAMLNQQSTGGKNG